MKLYKSNTLIIMEDYHQKTIIIGKKHTRNSKVIEKKLNINAPNKVLTNSAKIERDHDEGKSLNYWGVDYGRQVTQARTKAVPKMSQVQLAEKLKVKPDIVKNIENGKGLYNGQLANKIFRILKVKRNK